MINVRLLISKNSFKQVNSQIREYWYSKHGKELSITDLIDYELEDDKENQNIKIVNNVFVKETRKMLDVMKKVEAESGDIFYNSDDGKKYEVIKVTDKNIMVMELESENVTTVLKLDITNNETRKCGKSFDMIYLENKEGDSFSYIDESFIDGVPKQNYLDINDKIIQKYFIIFLNAKI